MTIDAIDISPGAIIAGKYKIVHRLGAGGMGAVFLAENLDIGRKVALKLLHPKHSANEDLVRRFRLEARAAAAIAHPNIVDVIDLGTTEQGALFIVMEHLDGLSLRKRIEGQGRLAVAEVADLADEILEALEAAHAKQIIHRDLKPDNVFVVLRPRKAIKILDFGISKLRVDDALDSTETGAILGTPLYMPPEQARGSREVGAPADLYSVGAVLYHALAGKPPFIGKNLTEILSQVLQDKPVPLATLRDEVPAELSALVARLLEKSAADRPQTARAVRNELRRAVGRPIIERADPTPVAATISVAPPGGETVASVAAQPIGDAVAGGAPKVDVMGATAVSELGGANTTHAGTAGEIGRRDTARRTWPVALGATALVGAGLAIALILRGGGSSDERRPVTPADAEMVPTSTEAHDPRGSSTGLADSPDAPPLEDAAVDAAAGRDARPRTRADAAPTPADAGATSVTPDARPKGFNDLVAPLDAAGP